MSEKSSTFALGFDSEPNLLLNLRRINIRLSKVFFPALRSGRSAPSETVALAFGTWIAMAETAPLNQRATKASALPKNPRFSGAPRKMLR